MQAQTPHGAVDWFAGLMKAQLDKNSNKRGWMGDDLGRLLARAVYHVGKVGYALSHPVPDVAVKACVDAANFLMMIAHNFDVKVRAEQAED